jgi:predicted metalloprotease with PDZ domain
VSRHYSKESFVNPMRATLITVVVLGATLCPAAHVAAQPAAPAAPAAPATPVAPPAPPSPDERQLEAQLEVARKNLEQAAHEVAQLSSKLSGAFLEGVVPYLGPGRAVIGVQLDDSAGSGGARVTAVSPGGPAADAGVRVGDVVVALNGHPTTGSESVREVVGFLREVKPDTHVTLKVLREGQPREFVLTARAGPSLLASREPLPRVELPPLPELPELRGAFVFRRPLGDMELATLTPGLGSYFGSSHGVLVVRAPADGALKLEDGDVILAIDGREPTSGSHATRILASYQPGEKITLRLMRQHKNLELQTTVPDEPHGRRELQQERNTAGRVHAQPQRHVIYGTDSA